MLEAVSILYPGVRQKKKKSPGDGHTTGSKPPKLDDYGPTRNDKRSIGGGAYSFGGRYGSLSTPLFMIARTFSAICLAV